MVPSIRLSATSETGKSRRAAAECALKSSAIRAALVKTFINVASVPTVPARIIFVWKRSRRITFDTGCDKIRSKTSMENGGSSASSDPSSFLSEIIGAPVKVKLNSSVEYRGRHLNLMVVG